jgi:hypothetical protein
VKRASNTVLLIALALEEIEENAARRAAVRSGCPGEELEALDGQHEHEDREPPGSYDEQTHDRDSRNGPLEPDEKVVRIP